MTPQQQERKDKADKAMVHVRAILGQYVIRNASLEEDRKRATDLVLNVKNLTIAVRIRDPKYARWMDEITIRTSAGGGNATELQKIMSGVPDWMFYGFSESGEFPNPWYILDMNVFRQTLTHSPHAVTFTNVNNNDGSSFRAFRINSFPPSFVVGSSEMERAA